MRGSFRSIFWLVSSLFYIFAAQPRFLSSVQLLVNRELFHQSSFYLINIVSSVRLLFCQRSLHFSREGECSEEMSGKKCPIDPALSHSQLILPKHLLGVPLTVVSLNKISILLNRATAGASFASIYQA